MHLPFRIKLFLWLLAFSGVTAILFSSLLFAKLSKYGVEMPRRLAKTSVAQASIGVRSEDIEAIRNLGTEALCAHPVYAKLREHLLEIPMAGARVQNATLVPDDDWGEAWIMVRTDTPGVGRFLVTVNPEETGGMYDMTRFPALMEGWSAVTADAEPLADEFGETLTAYAPILDAGGRSIAIIGLDIPAQHLRLNQRDAIMATAAAFCIVSIGSFLVAQLASRRLTQPLFALAQGVQRIQRDELDTPIVIAPRKDELGELVGHFNTMLEMLRERKRARHTMAVAASVQRHLLPATMPRIPGLDIAAACEFCDETGGDYYDAICVGDDAVLIAAGDVSGHGVPAALLMASVRGVLRSHSSLASVDLGAALHAVDHHVVHDLPPGNFITMLVAHVKPAESGGFLLTYVSAGHEPILIMRAAAVVAPRPVSVAATTEDPFHSGDFDEDFPRHSPPPPPEHLEATGPPLGVDETIVHEEAEPVELRAGDIALILTDGVRECLNPALDEYGFDRAARVVETHRHRPAVEIVRALMDDLRAHHASPSYTDDVTAVVLKVV